MLKNNFIERAEAEKKALDTLENALPKYSEDVIEEAKKCNITPAKLVAMKTYAKYLVAKNPKMKASTVRQRVCEKFNIQLS